MSLDKAPMVNSSGSIVRACDYDGDGFTDLFIGGRSQFGKYPLPDKSYLLKNDKGVLKDVTKSMIPEILDLGMLTDALWLDVDGDQLQDLVVVGELMPITVFKNNKVSFSKLTETNLEAYLGWWESIEKGDFDNDGDMDFIVGNLGRNNLYQPSTERPVTLIAKDFDGNGSIDPILFAHFKDMDHTYRSFPVNFWGDLSKQSPLFRSKFSLYKEFAKTTAIDFFTAEEKEGALTLTGNYDRSVYVENLGHGQFKIHELPMAAQFAPINGILPLDYDSDGNLDVLLVGNNFGNEIFIGRLDAFNGLLLKGNGKGEFTPLSTKETGFLVPGDAKAILSINHTQKEQPLIVVSQNRDSLRVFSGRRE
jgi:enediyne biosynthesis protein E4